MGLYDVTILASGMGIAVFRLLDALTGCFFT